MPDERALVFDLIIIIAAATGGGVLASALRLPVVLGYLVAGLVIRQYVPGLEIDIARVQDIAELGVALLLFTLGIQFSLSKMAVVRKVAVIGGLAQIVFTIGLGLAIGSAVGLDVEASVVLGAAMALSSTMVALKLLDARGETDTLHGRVAVGFLLVQDLAVVPLVILIPSVGTVGMDLVGDLAVAGGKALLLLGAVFLLGNRVVPWLLHRIAGTGSRELFLLAVLSLALGLAAGSYALGLSIAFGAFLAGLIVSESEYSYQTLAEVLPLRDVFATIFFVAMGMLIDPAVLKDDPTLVVSIVAGLVIGKTLLTALPIVLLGYAVRTAVATGVLLAQAGEFSFVLAQVALDENIISEEVNSAILMAVLLSIVANPLLLQAGPWVLSRMEAIPRFGQFFLDPIVIELGADAAALRQHVVVCGYGRVGRELVHQIVRRDFRCVVIETNPYHIDRLRESGIPRVYGDAANEAVLKACGLERARVLAVTIPDPAAAQLVVIHAKRINPEVDVIVRGRTQEDHQELLAAGADEVVHPEFEAGLEFVRHALQRYGVDSTQIQALLARRRRDFHLPR